MITFCEPLEQSSLCASWGGANDTDPTPITGAGIAINDNGAAHDSLSVASTAGLCNGNAPQMGVIDLGTTAYAPSGTIVFDNSTIAWHVSARQLVFTLGTPTGGIAGTFLPFVPAIYSPNAAMEDIGGNTMTGAVSFTDRHF